MLPSEELTVKARVHNIAIIENILVGFAGLFDLNLKRTPARSMSHLHGVQIETIFHIERTLGQLLDVFKVCADEDLNPWDDKEFFRLSMAAMHMSFSPDFLDSIKDEDIIEAYDLNRRQIFRNMRFMESSSYSLVEILSYDWPTLFQRSSKITESIIKVTEKDLWSANRIVRSDIPKHHIRELLSRSPQVCEIHHKFFAPLYSGPNQPSGILSVCECLSIIAESELRLQNHNLSYI